MNNVNERKIICKLNKFKKKRIDCCKKDILICRIYVAQLVLVSEKERNMQLICNLQKYLKWMERCNAIPAKKFASVDKERCTERVQ